MLFESLVEIKIESALHCFDIYDDDCMTRNYTYFARGSKYADYRAKVYVIVFYILPLWQAYTIVQCFANRPIPCILLLKESWIGKRKQTLRVHIFKGTVVVISRDHTL